MYKSLSLFFIFLISLSLITQKVRAEQIEYLSFEGFTLTSDNTTISITHTVDESGSWKVLKTIYVDLGDQKYLAGFRLKWHAYLVDDSDGTLEGVTYNIRVKVNGNVVWTGVSDQINEGSQYTEYHEDIQQLFDIYGSSFTITIEAYRSGTLAQGDFYTTFDAMYIYFTNDNVGIKSKLTELKYIPPGADNTIQGFLLNRTEIYLNQIYNLTEGALKFWLKWDGTKDIRILDNLGINSNGYLYVQDSNGNTYILDGITPTIGAYVQAAFGWKAGYGYIILNQSIIRFNWQGNFTLSKIGDISNTTGTIIDELVVFNSFISEDYILNIEGTESFSININGTIYKVYPDGGTHLPVPTTVSFYDANDTLLAYYDWYGSNKIYDAPNGTYKVVLSAGGVSSIYIVNALESDIAFLSSDASGVIESISIIPVEAGTLTIKNTKGQIVYADTAKSTNTVLGVLGGKYYIKFTDSNNITRAAAWFTFSGEGITILLSSSIEERGGLYADAWWDAESKVVKIEFVDDLNATNYFNLKITFSRQGQTITTYNITEYSRYYIGSFIPPEDADFAYIEIKGDNGFEKTWGVWVNEALGTSKTSNTVFPVAALIGIFGIGGLLIAPARFKFISPLIATFILGIGKISGIIDTPAWLLSSLMGISILSLIIYRGESR